MYMPNILEIELFEKEVGQSHFHHRHRYWGRQDVFYLRFGGVAAFVRLPRRRDEAGGNWLRGQRRRALS